MRRFKFFFIPHGPTKMCVYKGSTGRITKNIKEEGTTWPWDFSLQSRPIWCGSTTLIYDAYYDFGIISWGGWKQKHSGIKRAGTYQESCSLAWAEFNSNSWGGPYLGNTYCYIKAQDRGIYGVDTQVWGSRAKCYFSTGLWYLAFPGVQPSLIRLTIPVNGSGPDVGSVKFPFLGVSVPLNAPSVVIEVDVSGLYFDPNRQYFYPEIDESSYGYCQDPGGGELFYGARIGRNYGKCRCELWGGGGGWEYIDIPDWIFELPGKYWLAMVDAAGVMLPGPYMPLN